MTDSRYARQAILPEIGEAGQARIAAATAVVRARGAAAEIAKRYLVAAGFGAVHVEEASDAIAPPFDARDASARAVAEGAYRALVELRKAIACD
jgi:hypothetical protein